MPRYEYSCSTCGKTFEVDQRMSDAPLTNCTCGSEGTVERLLGGGGGVIFKGKGFYQTDYRGSSPAPSAESATKTESAPKPAGGGHSCGPGCCHG